MSLLFDRFITCSCAHDAVVSGFQSETSAYVRRPHHAYGPWSGLV